MIDSPLARTPLLESELASDADQPRRLLQRAVFLLFLFLIIFVAVRLTIRPINDHDFLIYRAALGALLDGKSPYTIPDYFNPPWTAFLLAPLAHQPLETWLALTVAIFVVAVFDRGRPASLLMLMHPIFIVLLASSNPDWIIVGTGLWLLNLAPRGWGRGLAWLFLSSKPQTTWILLIFDGIVALRTRDWKAFFLAGSFALITFLLTPMTLALWSVRAGDNTWSLPIVFNYGIPGALIATLFVIIVRWQRREDYLSLGLILSLIWTPYALQYAFVTMLFIMRKAGWRRILFYVIAGIILAGLFWDEFHVQEEIGAAGMLLLAAMLAPSNAPVSSGRETSTKSVSHALTTDQVTI